MKLNMNYRGLQSEGEGGSKVYKYMIIIKTTVTNSLAKPTYIKCHVLNIHALQNHPPPTSRYNYIISCAITVSTATTVTRRHVE